jgi:acyl-CoA thioester hydrolase
MPGRMQGRMPGNMPYERFEQPIPILAEDIDILGHVNNVVYVRWVQEVSAAHWNARATAEQREKYGWMVVRHEVDYLWPARQGEAILGRTWVGVAQRHIFERFVEIVRAGDGKLLARARSLWCPVDLRTHRLTRPGPDVYARFSVPEESGSTQSPVGAA